MLESYHRRQATDDKIKKFMKQCLENIVRFNLSIINITKSNRLG